MRTQRDDNEDGLFYRLQKENALLPPQVKIFYPLDSPLRNGH